MSWIRSPLAAWSGAALAMVVLGMIAFGWTMPTLREAAAVSASGRIDVSFASTPRWMSPADLTPIQEIVIQSAGPSPYDRAGLERAREALASSGWFDSVAQVRRTGANSIEVDAVFAQPTALVSDRNGDHLVDGAGKLMPRSYAHGTAPAITRITGVKAPRPPRAGEIWPGADLAAAIEMAKLVGMQRWRAQVASIDVSEFDRAQSIALTTSGGCRLNWGRAPGAEAAAEVPASQKLRYLDLLHSQYGRLDAAGQQSIDLSVDYVGSR